MVLEQLAEIGFEADVLLEPARRDSGPAIAAGAAFARTRDSEAVVLALAADHVVHDDAGLSSRPAAKAESPPSGAHRHLRRQAGACRRPNTATSARARSVSGEVRAVAKFVEKPDAENAAEYIKAGLSLEQRQLHVPRPVLLDEYRNLDPDSVRGGHRRGEQGRTRSRLYHAGARRFGAAKAISIDYAVMEKTRAQRDAGVLRLVGRRLLARGVGIVGQGCAGQRRAWRRGVRGFAQLQRRHRQGAGGARGVDDLVVVATQDAVLVSRQKDANGLKGCRRS